MTNSVNNVNVNYIPTSGAHPVPEQPDVPKLKLTQPLECDTVKLKKTKRNRALASFFFPGRGQYKNGDFKKSTILACTDGLLACSLFFFRLPAKAMCFAGAAMLAIAGYSAYDAYENCKSSVEYESPERQEIRKKLKQRHPQTDFENTI